MAASADPLAGSYLVESLTDRIEAEVLAELAVIDELGGAVAAIEDGRFEVCDSLGRAAPTFPARELT